VVNSADIGSVVSIVNFDPESFEILLTDGSDRVVNYAVEGIFGINSNAASPSASSVFAEEGISGDIQEVAGMFLAKVSFGDDN